MKTVIDTGGKSVHLFPVCLSCQTSCISLGMNWCFFKEDSNGHSWLFSSLIWALSVKQWVPGSVFKNFVEINKSLDSLHLKSLFLPFPLFKPLFSTKDRMGALEHIIGKNIVTMVIIRRYFKYLLMKNLHVIYFGSLVFQISGMGFPNLLERRKQHNQSLALPENRHLKLVCPRIMKLIIINAEGLYPFRQIGTGNQGYDLWSSPSFVIKNLWWNIVCFAL